MKTHHFIIVGAVSMAIAVLMGAFGAHGLKTQLTEYAMGVYQTAVQYQIYHSLGLILIGAIGQIPNMPHKGLTRSGLAMALGILIFSGSLYLLAFTGIKWLGAITPVGGLLMVISWLLLAWTVFKHSSFRQNTP